MCFLTCRLLRVLKGLLYIIPLSTHSASIDRNTLTTKLKILYPVFFLPTAKPTRIVKVSCLISSSETNKPRPSRQNKGGVKCSLGQISNLMSNLTSGSDRIPKSNFLICRRTSHQFLPAMLSATQV